MIEIRGKYNYANVMIDVIDASTRKQIQNFVNNPSFAGSYISIMPDCHAGAGSCIGFTMPMNDRIIPDVVGVDIGCGMLSCKFNAALDVREFDKYIKSVIPSGFSVNQSNYKGEDFFSKVAKKLGMDDRVYKSLGSLGGGNHFIEAGKDSSGSLWVTIHSGSRNFGLQIAGYHGGVARALCKRADYKGIPFLLVDSSEGQEYITDQQIGVRYASKNREIMMSKIISFLGKPEETIESRHNFIDETGMIRKGATPAQKDQKLVIPFNMRDGLAICVGKGNKKYNFSAPHGAGRILSRSQAKKQLDVEFFKEDLRQAGVYTTTACSSTLDESPDAYKDKSVILENISETVEVLDFVKPCYNFKGV